MSDETPSPPLRLKPRQQPDAGAPDAAAGADEGKLRLRPKLAGAAAATVPAPPVAPVEPDPETSPPAVERIRLKPTLSMEPDPVAPEPPVETPPGPETAILAPPPAPEEGQIKLKIRLPAVARETAAPPAEPADPPFLDEATAPPVLAEAAAPLTIPPSPPPFPMVASPAPEAGETMVPPPPLPEMSHPGVLKRPRIPAAQRGVERQRALWKYALIAVGGVLLAGGVIGGAYLKFTEPLPPVRLPPPRTRPLPVPEVAVPAPVPSKVAVPTVEAVVPAGPGSATRVVSTATVELTPGVLATTESVKAVPSASPAFRTFVASTRISGVYQGTPPRAFINGRLVHTGEIVDPEQEIYFDSVDLANRSIVFKDAGGATVSRRY